MANKGTPTGLPEGPLVPEGDGTDKHPPGQRPTLGPYWQGKLGKSRFRALQVSPRTGTLTVEVNDDRVHLGGSAVTAVRGSLAAEPQKRGRADASPSTPPGSSGDHPRPSGSLSESAPQGRSEGPDESEPVQSSKQGG